MTPNVIEMEVDGAREYLITVEGGQVASCRASLIEGDWLAFYCLWVRPDYRRRGIATAILQTLANLALHNRLKGITCCVHKENGRALAFYKVFSDQRMGTMYAHEHEDPAFQTLVFPFRVALLSCMD